MKRFLGCFFAFLIILLPTAAHASTHSRGRTYREGSQNRAFSDYDGRDRDGGYSYRHHRHGDDGYDDDGGDGNGYSGDQYDRCRSGGCNNRSRRCDRSSGDCRSSFSPGPFKDSPVYICAPYSCNSGGQQSGSNDGNGDGKQPPKQPAPKDDEETGAPSCLVNVPWHCDSPRNPG